MYFLHLYLHSVSKILYYLYWRYVNSFPSTLPVSSSLVWSLQPLFASFSLWSLFPNPSCLDSPQFQLYALCLTDLCSLLKTCFPEPHFRTGVDKKISFFFFSWCVWFTDPYFSTCSQGKSWSIDGVQLQCIYSVSNFTCNNASLLSVILPVIENI